MSYRVLYDYNEYYIHLNLVINNDLNQSLSLYPSSYY